MDQLTAALIGAICAAFGLLIPGMLTMTTMRLSLTRGVGPALLYGAGIALAYTLQVGIATGLSSFIGDASEVIEEMTQWSIGLFALLFLVFAYRGWTQEPEEEETVDAEEEESPEPSDFLNGLGVALVNFVVVPGFFALSTWAIQSGWMEGDTWSRVLFAVGAGAGAFGMFATYALLARWLEDHARWVTDNVNWILAAIFLGLVFFRAYKMLTACPAVHAGGGFTKPGRVARSRSPPLPPAIRCRRPGRRSGGPPRCRGRSSCHTCRQRRPALR